MLQTEIKREAGVRGDFHIVPGCKNIQILCNCLLYEQELCISSIHPTDHVQGQNRSLRQPFINYTLLENYTKTLGSSWQHKLNFYFQCITVSSPWSCRQTIGTSSDKVYVKQSKAPANLKLGHLYLKNIKLNDNSLNG